MTKKLKQIFTENLKKRIDINRYVGVVFLKIDDVAGAWSVWLRERDGRGREKIIAYIKCYANYHIYVPDLNKPMQIHLSIATGWNVEDLDKTLIFDENGNYINYIK